jgi:coenzyme F420-0:L-glutamate ligase/coenzyme F420-1:gamma-L-glutamate ligase
MTEVRIIPVRGVPEVIAGDDLALLIVDAAGEGAFEDLDVVVVTQKVVSKSEGRCLKGADKEAVVIAESKRVLRRTSDGMAISETHHGFVCANAGVDQSNVERDSVSLLPVDPDASARRIRSRIKHLTGVDVSVLVSDTFGRPWRLGQTNVAIGVAGIEPFVDYRGMIDTHGHSLTATRIAVADEIAGAAELVMGKTAGICAAIVRGARVMAGRGAASELIRPSRDDLFR